MVPERRNIDAFILPKSGGSIYANGTAQNGTTVNLSNITTDTPESLTVIVGGDARLINGTNMAAVNIALMSSANSNLASPTNVGTLSNFTITNTADGANVSYRTIGKIALDLTSLPSGQNYLSVTGKATMSDPTNTTGFLDVTFVFGGQRELPGV